MIKVNGICVESISFPAGEVGVRVDKDMKPDINGNITVTAMLRSSNDVMSLLMVVDAIKRVVPKPSPMKLVVPYFPYARQDRVTCYGESLSLQVMAGLVNVCGFDEVVVLDPHSAAVEMLVNNIKVVSQKRIVKKMCELDFMVAEGKVLVSPDVGAREKAFGISKVIPFDTMVVMNKRRDPVTGKLGNATIDGECAHLVGATCMIVDDICDGGRTFINAAIELKKHGAKSVELFVTHGVFSKGFSELSEHIDHIYTTNSYCQLESDSYLTVVDHNTFLPQR
jgi:ribose-phosphate pyrophosphokinase